MEFVDRDEIKGKGEWNNEEDYGNASEHEEQK